MVVACAVTDRRDAGSEPLLTLTQIEENTGERPARVSSDARYGSEVNLEAMADMEIDSRSSAILSLGEIPGTHRFAGTPRGDFRALADWLPPAARIKSRVAGRLPLSLPSSCR